MRRIDAFSTALDKAAFMADLKTQDAVIRNMEVIGEACSNIRKLAPEFAQAHPEVPWGSAIGNRNALSHGYFSVDLELVWATMQTDLPALKVAIERLLALDP
ncbi:MAG: HepT-like ribonuclease domain-containing protein [Polaromonas sp.]